MPSVSVLFCLHNRFVKNIDGQQIKFEMEEMFIEPQPECAFDFIAFYDGTDI